jgi:ABC-type amino acid transport substrate-binding protein
MRNTIHIAAAAHKVCAALCLLILLVCGQGRASGAEELPPLRVAVDVPSIPFAMMDKRGNLSGFDVDIARALCVELQRVCVIRPMVFEGIIPAVVAGEIDIAVAGIGANEERRRLVDFTDKYYRSVNVYIEKRGNLKGASPEKIEGLRIGAAQGTLQEQYLRKRFNGTADIVTAASQDEVLGMVREGRLDLALVEGLSGYFFLKTEAGESLETVGEPLINSYDGSDAAARIVVSKKQPELRDAINKAIQALRRSGEYGKINRKYFDFTIY